MEKKTQMKVQFINVKEDYTDKEDILCYFVYHSKSIPQEGDRVAIMNLGWKSLKDFEMFEFVSDSDSFNTADTPCITFRRDEFPEKLTKSDQLFQFCYISTDNNLVGVSTAFQVIRPRVVTPARKVVPFSVEEEIETKSKLKQTITRKNQEIVNLKEENAVLKECLKSAYSVTKNQKCLNYDEEISQLKDLISTLKSTVLIQQKEIDAIKTEVSKEREQRRLFDKIHLKVIGNNYETNKSNFDLSNLESLPPCPLQ